MTVNLMSRRYSARLISTSLLAAALLLAGPANAETIFSINGVDVDSAVVDMYFNSRLGGKGGQATPEQREALMSELRDIYLLTTQDNAKALENDPQIAAQIELQKRSILAQAVASEFFKATDVSEEELLATYNEQVKMAPPLQFKARHILVETQGEAQAIIDQLDAGADFEELAKEKSKGPSGPNGGELDWFSPNQMVAPFTQAVEALEDGSYTKTPVQTQFGWHVILREASRKTEPPTFEASRENLEAAIRNKKFQDHLGELRKQAAE